MILELGFFFTINIHCRGNTTRNRYVSYQLSVVILGYSSRFSESTPEISKNFVCSTMFFTPMRFFWHESTGKRMVKSAECSSLSKCSRQPSTSLRRWICPDWASAWEYKTNLDLGTAIEESWVATTLVCFCLPWDLSHTSILYYHVHTIVWEYSNDQQDNEMERKERNVILVTRIIYFLHHFFLSH